MRLIFNIYISNMTPIYCRNLRLINYTGQQQQKRIGAGLQTPFLYEFNGAEFKNQVNFYPRNQIFVLQEMADFTKNSGFYIKRLTLTYTFTTKYTEIHCYS